MVGAGVKVGFLEVKVTKEGSGITEIGQTVLGLLVRKVMIKQTDRKVPGDTGRGTERGIERGARDQPIRWGFIVLLGE